MWRGIGPPVGVAVTTAGDGGTAGPKEGDAGHSAAVGLRKAATTTRVGVCTDARRVTAPAGGWLSGLTMTALVGDASGPFAAMRAMETRTGDAIGCTTTVFVIGELIGDIIVGPTAFFEPVRLGESSKCNGAGIGRRMGEQEVEVPSEDAPVSCVVSSTT